MEISFVAFAESEGMIVNYSGADASSG